ncbi:MAG: alpha/beta hydrolase [Pseudomonadota bacterium]
MAQPTPEWLDAQYNNRARVPDHPRILERWATASALTRERSSRRLDLRYGNEAHQTLDMFLSPRDRAPVLLFIHGGYWRALDKSDQSFLAASFVADGAMVVIPNYALCPAVTVETIALQLVDAVAWTVRHAALYGGDPSRLVVAGHSAGGHLAAMMLSCDWASVGLPARAVSAAMAISGLFDLAPVARVPFLQQDLKLTPASVRRLSPALFPAPRGRLLALVGGDESEEFKRQNRLIREAWGAKAVPVCEEVPGTNHFTVLHELADPASRMHRLALDLLQIKGAGT